jgi:hypothetical protein
MGQEISRRLFLKGGLATAAGLAAASIPGAAATAQPDEAKQLATRWISANVSAVKPAWKPARK